mmetsp:Transcript_14045/g.30408  ORF Transcript_14045/g.30408 Transcript_14045/m.30408 type:complete len:424 (+) Transcript_14045:382-1653(+)|eukprot:CAMPEP_0202902502 /NCGR_PEP_ID=MMETSP1392-20130828/16890_1 /ASSEMBLY_ACC=CAM_ASM_000868 /TAXON_ID=225041 /ORGANISM="Chlamydomonas chlamydogama, Strain SAG 11-48b" /LENGTH=423 /DNA_ID=CAMNT_0049589275 /DNA_START=379 /DNA_END=1650 /DNA_ORIENTATION=-
MSQGAQSQGKPRQRVYEVWQGNEKFFCWGYLVAGPNWKASLGTAFLIVAPAAVFLALVAPYLMFEVHAIIMVFSCFLPTLSLIFLFLTACRDPGIIPRQEPDEEYLSGRKSRTKEVFVNNHRVMIRYNDTCHFYQPPRAHHCSVNDNCIERFDHHCPWVGTTIGKRNYRTFLLFIYTSTVLCLYVFGCCLAQLFVKHNELQADADAQGDYGANVWGKTIGQVIPAIVLMAFTFLFFWFVGGLSMFHCYLVGSNQTTYENFRYNHDDRPNPYNMGVFANCYDVWCLPVPASKVNFRAFTDEVQRQPDPMTVTPEAPMHQHISDMEQQYQQDEYNHPSAVQESYASPATNDLRKQGMPGGELVESFGGASAYFSAPTTNQSLQQGHTNAGSYSHMSPAAPAALNGQGNSMPALSRAEEVHLDMPR